MGATCATASGERRRRGRRRGREEEELDAALAQIACPEQRRSRECDKRGRRNGQQRRQGLAHVAMQCAPGEREHRRGEHHVERNEEIRRSVRRSRPRSETALLRAVPPARPPDSGRAPTPLRRRRRRPTTKAAAWLAGLTTNLRSAPGISAAASPISAAAVAARPARSWVRVRARSIAAAPSPPITADSWARSPWGMRDKTTGVVIGRAA